MALMDKMKQQANQLAQKAQEAGKAGQAKVEELQTKRKADDLLRELGSQVFAQKTGTGGDPAKIDDLVSQLTQLEAESASSATPSASAAPAAEDPSTPEGGFKLD
jgi:hypothetical protein